MIPLKVNSFNHMKMSLGKHTVIHYKKITFDFANM